MIPTKVALEAQAQELARQEALAAPVLSLEEEAIEVGEQTALANDIVTDIADAHRVTELTDALEDIAGIASEIETCTPAEAKLIEAAGQVAVAGTDIAPEEIVPAMEGYVGGRIAVEALEDLKARAKQIWAKILEFVKKIWKKITEFFYKIFGAIPRLRSSIAKLEDSLDDLNGKAAEQGTKIVMHGVAALSVNFSPIKGEGELKSAIDTLGKAAEYVFGDVASFVESRGKDIEHAIKNFEPAKSNEVIEAMRATLSHNSPKHPPSAGSKDTTRFPGWDTYVGTPLMGNVSVALRLYNENPEDSALGVMDRHQRSGWELVSSNEKGSMKADAKIEMAPLTIGEMKNILRSLAGVLDTVEKFKRDGKQKALESLKDGIERASSAAEKKLSAYKTSSAADERACVANYRKLLDFNGAYAGWVGKPAVRMTTHTLQSVRAVVAVVQKSIAAYK
jgi:hypothetical protein